MSAPRILVVEDDAAIRRGLELALAADGFEPVPAATLAAARSASGPFALALVDVMLPDGSGLTLCQHLRATLPQLPIVVVSARGAESDVIRGLELGADDYVVKPFRVGELLARIRARLRRSPARTVHRFGDVEVDLATRRVTRGGEAVELSPTEFDLLALFVQRRGDPLPRHGILDAVWGATYEGTDRTVDNFVTRLRQKLDTPGAPRFFLTVRGVGYRFEVPEDDA